MTLTLPEGPRGRALALGLTASVLVALWLGVGQPLVQAYGDGADELEQRSALAARMAKIAGSVPELQREVAAQSANLTPPANAALQGASDALAGAALQSLIESMSNSAGGHLTSTEALPAQQVGAYRRIALRVTVDAHWPVLMRLIQAIERARPSMFIDDLQIRARPVAKTREPPLIITFTVQAFRAATSDTEAAPAAPRPSPASGDRQ